jgi:glycosyltransferase involved in cell wall biosynthesis
MRILFVAWDNPSVNYLEGLFVPIFARLGEQHGHEFHVMQFSWATAERIRFLEAFCRERGVRYTHVPVTLRPVATIGKYLTLFRGARVLSDYIRQQRIDVLMPRSFMPARMALSIAGRHPGVQLIYDADGLPIEERVDFAGLKPGSFRHRQLKKVEGAMIRRASRILTRTRRAIDFLVSQYQVTPQKFFVVKNGRDESFFVNRHRAHGVALREQLSIPASAFVLIYCGSLGPQYGVEEMFTIYQQLRAANEHIYFVLLTNNPGFVQDRAAGDARVVVRQVPFAQIPDYLSIADLAFAIRKPTSSMRGVAPIKLGEYLLMNLPVIASAAIGDTTEMLSGQDFVFLLQEHNAAQIAEAVQWARELPEQNFERRPRSFGERYFSLRESVTSYQTALSGLS